MKRIFIFCCLIVIAACKTSPELVPQKEVIVRNAAVVSAHPLASEIGLDILQKGGNAIDAAVAVQFALAVVYPQAGNIGGGGFMLYRDKDGKSYALDYRERAPAKATTDMYLDSIGNVIEGKSLYGFLAAGVPGTVVGMDEAYQRFSKLQDWKLLIEPAIKLAREGHYLTEKQLEDILEHQEDIRKYSPSENPFTGAVSTTKKFIQEDLAKTLEAIRDNGRYGFTTGWVADSLVTSMKKNGGLVSALDLLHYKPKWRSPTQSYYRGHKVLTMPLPSSAGVLIPQMCEILNGYNVSARGFHSPDAIHLIAEIERRAFADRAMHLGDPDFVDVPIYNLLHSQYLRDRMNDFDQNKATPSQEVRGGVFYDSPQTTHFSIVDNDGNAVSMTTTLNGRFGSKSVVPGAGFFLNNEMDDFSVKPGSPNLYGLVGGEANKIQPTKRMLSSMTPTIVEKDNRLFMVLGSPGGSTIPTTVLQVLVNVLDFGMDLKSAIDAPRFHHQWLPDAIQIEPEGFDEMTLEALREKGHEIKVRDEVIGQCNAILISNNGTITAVGDRRKDNSASGY